MKNKDIIHIINEELQEFDFLSIDEIENENNLNKFLNDKSFQTRFIHDLINNYGNKSLFKDEDITYKSTSEDDLLDKERLSIEYGVDVTYIFNDKDIRLSLNFTGDNIDYDIETYDKPSTYTTPSEYNVWYDSIDWEDIDFNIFNEDGDEINFDWLKQNKDMYNKLVSSMIRPILSIEFEN